MFLAGIGSAIGVGLAWGAVTIVTHMGPVNLPRAETLGLDERTLAFAVMIGICTTVLSGLVPALRISRIDVSKLVKGLSATKGVLPKRTSASSAFVVVQLSMAFVLLVGAGLLVRSFARLVEVDPGFEAEGRLALRLQERESPDRSPEEARAVAMELFRRVRALPGVRSVASATPLPFGQGAIWGPIEVDGYVARTDDPPVIADRRWVSPGYFETMGIRLVAGRLFDERDARPGAAPVRIVDRPFAEHFWPGQDAMGKWIGSENPRFPEDRRGMVVGVVEHVRHYALETDGRMTVYLPSGEINRTYLIVQTDGDPNVLVRPVTDVAHAIDRQMVVTDVRTMAERLADARAQRRLGLLLMQGFALVALVLGAIGLYGVVAHGVSQGASEIGIRVALGASATNIVGFVLGYGIRITSLGVGAGLLLSWVINRAVGSLLFKVSATDPATYLGINIVLGSVCLVACWIPSRRAAQLNPLDALRSDG